MLTVLLLAGSFTFLKPSRQAATSNGTPEDPIRMVSSPYKQAKSLCYS